MRRKSYRITSADRSAACPHIVGGPLTGNLTSGRWVIDTRGFVIPRPKVCGATAALSRDTAQAFLKYIIVTDTFSTDVFTRYLIFILDDFSALVIFLGTGYGDKLVVGDFIKLTGNGLVGDQECSTFGPIHTEEVDIGAVVELICGQVDNPDVVVVDSFEGDKMVIAGDM